MTASLRDTIVLHRLELADFSESLTPDQLDADSLIPTWRVYDVFAHLALGVAPTAFFQFLWSFARERGNFDRAADRVTFAFARRPLLELSALLRRRAHANVSPPGMGQEMMATELLIHELDMRQPLSMMRPFPAERVRFSLDFVTSRRPRALTRSSWWEGTRLVATDLDWEYGNGPAVRAPSTIVLLAMAGRTRILPLCDGEGVAQIQRQMGRPVDIAPAT